MPGSQKEPDDVSLLHHDHARQTFNTMASTHGHGADIASLSVHVGASLNHLQPDPALSGGTGLFCSAQPGGSSMITNANGTDFQLFDAIDLSGGYESYQALLQSVLCQPPSIATGMYDISDQCVVPDDNDAMNAYKFVENTIGATSNCHANDELDESGYVSSDSSVYDVNSDDEFYGNDVNICPMEDCNDVESNLDDCNIIEEMPEETNQHGAVVVEEETNQHGPNAVEGTACPCLSTHPFLHVMTELKDDSTNTWKKRHRTPKGKKRADCRVPKGMGAIEIALRNAPYRKTKYIFEPLLGLTFDSEHGAYEYYNMYSWEVGFGIKKKRRATNQKTNFHTMRELHCLCSGTPKECQNNTKLTGCKAMIRLLRTEDDGWYIKFHEAEHNHELMESCGQKRQWLSHDTIDDRAVELITYLRENNVSLTKVHCIMGSMYGSMENIPGTKRSLRAICEIIPHNG
ncbi:unnamed protein product [Urochloa humidicola]